MKTRIMALLMIFCLLAGMATFNEVSAVSALRVQFYNANRVTDTDKLTPMFKIINTGSTPVDLTNVKLRYYFTTEDTSQTLYFYSINSSIGASNLSGKFGISLNYATANRYLEVSFKTGSIAPNQEVTAECKIRASNNSRFNQTNEYSFNSSASSYTEWGKVTAYLSGDPVWGTPPNAVAIQSLQALEVDAVSAKLNWIPLESPYSDMVAYYELYRDNVSIGRTSSKTGYFSDFGLDPNRGGANAGTLPYKYQVKAIDNSGTVLAESNSILVVTTTTAKVKSTYKVLAIAFDPVLPTSVPARFASAPPVNGVSIAQHYTENMAGKRVSELGTTAVLAQNGMKNEFEGNKTKHKVKEEFLEYAKDTFKTLSNQSINFEAYQNKVVTINEYPPAANSNFQQSDEIIVEMACTPVHCSQKGCDNDNHLGNTNANIIYDVHPHGSIDYGSLASNKYEELGGNSIIDLIEKGEIDGVWLLGATPLHGFEENALLGNRDIGNVEEWRKNRWIEDRAFKISQDPSIVQEAWESDKSVACSKSFFFSLFSADYRLYDGYLHMFEGIMACISDDNQDNWKFNIPYDSYNNSNWTVDGTPIDNTISEHNFNLWGRFRATDRQNQREFDKFAPAAPGKANVGSSHFPPNSERAYDYGWDRDATKSMSNYVLSCADDWYSYPELPVAPVFKMIGAYDFGAYNNYKEGTSSKEMGYQKMSYHTWWLNHLPHNPGVKDGKLNNWWYYIYDFNRFDGREINYGVTGFPPAPPIVYERANSEYGTELEQAPQEPLATVPPMANRGLEWGYWHSNNATGKNANLTMAASDGTGNVKVGNYSLKAEINCSKVVTDGWHELFYPVYKNAGWDLTGKSRIKLYIKPGQNFSLVSGTNPVIRLCMDSGNKIEYVPKTNDLYKNALSGTNFMTTDGWYLIGLPFEGNTYWERNIVGYVDPSLTGTEKETALNNIKNAVMKNVNYIEIAIGANTVSGNPNNTFSVYIDGLDIF